MSSWLQQRLKILTVLWSDTANAIDLHKSHLPGGDVVRPQGSVGGEHKSGDNRIANLLASSFVRSREVGKPSTCRPYTRPRDDWFVWLLSQGRTVVVALSVRAPLSDLRF